MAETSHPQAVAAEDAVIDGTTVDGAPVHAGTEAHGGEVHATPSALGMDATMWVSLAMLVVIGLAIWKKVPAIVAGMLDKQIDAIKAQLDQATDLRKQAEAIKAEYEAKAKAALADAEGIKAAADDEAKLIIAKAKSDAASLIDRRAKAAEDKIAAAERAAIADVRAKAASAATAAAAQLIAANHGAAADKALIDGAIATIS
jgi:F-type H+-transporting ATPase subunit b